MNNEVDEDGLSNYLQDEIQVEPVNIIINKTNKYNRSFKVTIKKNDRDRVLCPEAWESNIIIKPFRSRYRSEYAFNNNHGNSQFNDFLTPTRSLHNQYDLDDSTSRYPWI